MRGDGLGKLVISVGHLDVRLTRACVRRLHRGLALLAGAPPEISEIRFHNPPNQHRACRIFPRYIKRMVAPL